MNGFIAIPGYEGLYYINRDGVVCNSQGHIIKPVASQSELKVELRKDGQREIHHVDDLLKSIEGVENDETAGFSPNHS